MGLARAFTKRFVRPGTPDGPTKPRPTISMPMGLISTTNQSIHNYPNIVSSQTRAVQQRQITTSSGSSLNESDGNASSSPETPAMTDASSVESYSPIEPNHLTQYFPQSRNKSTRSSPVASVSESPFGTELEQHSLPQSEPKPDADSESNSDYAASEKDSTLSPIPVLPKRAPSHSKHEHERLARVRSVRSSAGPVSGISSVRESATEETLSVEQPIAPLRASGRPASDVAVTPASENRHQSTFNPFSAELVQLDEVAEEFCNYTSELTWEQEYEEDLRIMREKGLRSHRASEYLRDISVLRDALWDLVEEKEGVTSDDDDEDDVFHDAVSDWI